ncbi:TonB-dependent siderophore receptor [Tistrella bauzanensis]|uniref:TonB-dependent siderophore receptor n=1 Tax=Tistrella TaxID=171436 RepID=UPI0031F70DFF
MRQPCPLLFLSLGVSVATAALMTGAARADEAEALPTLQIEDRRTDPADPGRTEGSTSYGTDRVSVGGKSVREIREVPRSVTVMTRARLDDQNLTQLEDVARRTPGFLALSNDPGRSSIFSRGFELDNALVDGLPAPLSSIYGTQPDLAIFDRVELLRGPAGLFGGTGEPGGTVNLIRKRPTETFGARGTLEAGSWNNYRGVADVSGPIAGNGRVRGRVVGAYQDRESFTDTTDTQVGVGYAAIDADITDDTMLSLGVWRQEREGTPFNGLPVSTTGEFLDISRSTFIGADWNRFENSSNEAIASLTHSFDNGGRAEISGRATDRDVDLKYAYGSTAVDPAIGTTNLIAIQRAYEERSYALDAHYSQPFEALGGRHEILIGADWRRYVQTLDSGTARGLGTVNVYAPSSDIAEPDIAMTERTRVEPEQYGLYSRLTLRPVQDVTVLLGGRLSWYESTATDRNTGTTSTVDADAEFTPDIGLVYDLTDDIALYASYAGIFQPQTQLDEAGNPIEARSGEQYELGVKAALGDSGLIATLAAFRLRDSNRAVAITDSTRYAAGAEVEVRGIEAEVSGTILPGWEVQGGYTFTRTEYLKAATSTSGTTFSTYTPKHVVHAFTRYTLQNGPMAGVHVGGGVRWLSSFYNMAGALKIEEDGYVVTDLQAGWGFAPGYDLTLSVNNIFDETYYDRVGGAGLFNYYGAPRNAMLSLKASF